MKNTIHLSFSGGKYKYLPEDCQPIVCAGMEKKRHFSQLHVPSAIFLSALGWNTLAQIRGSNRESRAQEAKCSTVGLLSSQFGNKGLQETNEYNHNSLDQWS